MDMDFKTDVPEFINALNKVATINKGSGVVFKNRYFIFLNENWKPWPHIPEELFRKSFIVCLSDNKERHSTIIKSTFNGCESKLLSRKESHCNSSDYTGSPLEYTFDVTDVFVTDKPNAMKKNLVHVHNPLNVTEGRYICLLYTKMLNEPKGIEAISSIPLFVYCDCQDLNHISQMGIAKNHWSTIRNKGIITNKSQFPSMLDVKRKHLKGFSLSFSAWGKIVLELGVLSQNSFSSNSEIEVHVYSSYDVIADCALHKTEDLKPTTQGIVSIECSCSTFKQALEKPPTDSSCVLLVQAVAGNEYEGAHNRFKELQFIKTLCNGLITGEILWNNKNRAKFLLVRLQMFLDGLKRSRTTFKIKEKNTENDPSDFDSTFHNYITTERDDMDFTDHLWHILIQECSSYEELVDAFTFVFAELKNFPFMPFVYRTNSTTIGKIIRKMGTQHLSDINLEGSSPIKLLLEIGVEKLMKDYVMLFVGLEMVPYDFLKPYLSENKLSEMLSDNSSLAEYLDKVLRCLEKFHTVEELLIIFWSFLKSSKAELNGFVRMALKHYATVPAVDPTYIFKFPVSLCSVKHIIGKAKPIIWQATLKSSDLHFQKTSVLRICKKSGEATDISVTGPGSSPVYCMTEATFVKDNLEQGELIKSSILP